MPKNAKNAGNFIFFALIICIFDFFVVNLRRKIVLGPKCSKMRQKIKTQL